MLLRKTLLGAALVVVLVPAGAFAADRVAGNGHGNSKPKTVSTDMLCADCGGGGGGGTTTTTPPPPPPPPTTTAPPPPPPPPTTTTAPAPPPPNYNGQSLYYGGSAMLSSTDIAGPTRVLYGSSSLSCGTGYHLKTRVYATSWSGSIIGGIGWKVQYSLCYVPNSRIVWAQAFPAFSPTTSWPVNWDSLNDPGFPTTANNGSSATFRWQGTANSCVLSNVFCTHRHPGTQITFYPNNTETRSGWGG